MPIKTSRDNHSNLRIGLFFTHWAPVIAFCLLIFIQSSRPIPDLLPEIPLIDKGLHFAAWTFLSFLFYRAYGLHAPFSRRKDLLVWVSFLSAALYGLSDEIHQHFVPSRTADTLDFLADVAGSFCGAYISARLPASLFKQPAVLNIPSAATPEIKRIKSIDKTA